MSKPFAVIDADVLVYRIGFSCEKQGDLVDSEDVAIYRMDKLIDETLGTLQAEDHLLYLSGGINYRYSYNKEYKANRDESLRPQYYNLLRAYLLEGDWNCEVTDGIEADDAMSLYQSSHSNSIICSIDKDLHQIPGNHYNFVKKECYYFTEDEALKFFYKQLLIGDNVDNIKGVWRVGPKTAARNIDPADSELDMFERVQGLYDSDTRLVMNGICLWLQREPNQIWTPPNGAELFDDEGNETTTEAILAALQEQARSADTGIDSESTVREGEDNVPEGTQLYT